MTDVSVLVGRARSGDLGAFEEIVHRFRGMAYGYALSRLRDHHLAQDVTQDAFLDSFRLLGQIRDPAAFPGWFRRVVHKHCDRAVRASPVHPASVEQTPVVAAEAHEPERMVEASERQAAVRAAIASLPPLQREATILYYLRSYSQEEIAAFLGVATGTIRKRLFDARTRLKEWMMDSIGDVVRDGLPDELFSRKVIDALLARPRSLEIPGHPIREVWESIRGALPEYEIIHGEEVVEATVYESVDDQMGAISQAYRLSEHERLRTQMTHTLFAALRGRVPPVRLLSAGRCFRPDTEDASHSKVFHQMDAVCVDAGAGRAEMTHVCERIVASVLDSVELRWQMQDFGIVDSGLELRVRLKDEWVEIGGCGVLKPRMLQEAGYGAPAVGGFALGLGLERLAMVANDIDDIGML